MNENQCLSRTIIMNISHLLTRIKKSEFSSGIFFLLPVRSISDESCLCIRLILGTRSHQIFTLYNGTEKKREWDRFLKEEREWDPICLGNGRQLITLIYMCMYVCRVKINLYVRSLFLPSWITQSSNRMIRCGDGNDNHHTYKSF